MVEAGVKTALAARVESLGGCEVKAGEPLAPLTSVRAGGAAEALVRPRSPDALVALLKLAREEGVPVSILGGGANTLVGDGGVPGLTLKLPGDLFPEVADVGPEEGRLTPRRPRRRPARLPPRRPRRRRRRRWTPTTARR